MQQTSWNLRKLKRELRNCEAVVFTNLFHDFCHQFIVTMVGRPLRSSSCTLVQPFLNIMHHCRTPPSLITLFPYTLQSCRWISVGLWFFSNKNLITESTSQLAGFYIAAHISKIHGEQSRSSTNRMLPQLDAYWVRGRSDTKMAALAPHPRLATPKHKLLSG